MKPFSRSLLWLPLLSLVFSFSPSRKESVSGLTRDPRLMANAWFAFSAEKEACYLQTYRLAGFQLNDQLKKRKKGARKPAIVTDLDETLLDNSPWAIRVMLEGKDYPDYWSDWEKSGTAPAFPGAVAFFKQARSLGVEVYYISNRKAENLAGTLRNLRNLGLPYADSAHVLLKTTTSNKVERRSRLEKHHDIVMLLGDNLADFDGVWEDASESKRREAVDAYTRDWGSRFVIFPNPTYGSWRDAIFEYKRGLPDSTREAIWQKRSADYLKAHPF